MCKKPQTASRAVCIAIFLAIRLFGPPLWAEDWPQFLGPQANGISSETHLLDRWPTNRPPIAWKRALGTGYSAPSLLGGRLVVHHRVANEEIVECLETVSGKTLWKTGYRSDFQDPYGYNDGPRSAPLLANGMCYALGAEGVLLCVELNSGKEVWRRDTAKDFNVPQAFFGVGSSPVLYNDKLLVMVGGQPNSGMVAFEATTGKTLWQSVGEKSWAGQPMLGWPGQPPVAWKGWDKQASYATPRIAKVHGQDMAFCLMRQGLVALDPSTGEVLFSRWFRARVEESVNASNPVIQDDLVLISSAYYRLGSVLLRVHPDGKGFDEVWAGTSLEAHWTTPILHEGFLYAFSGRNEPDARLRCVEFLTGKLMWERDESWRPHSSKQPPVFGRGSFILADGKLIAIGEGGLLGIFRPNSSQVEEVCRWQVPDLEYPCWAAPALSGGKLLLRGEGKLVCIDLTPEKQR